MHRPYRMISFTFLSVFIADQLTKWWIFERVLRAKGEAIGLGEWLMLFRPLSATIESYGDFKAIEVTSFFNLVTVWNTGISFGVFQDAGDIMPYILYAFGAVAGVALLYMASRAKTCMEGLAYTLIAAGAIGNVWDRIRFKAVADFLDFHFAGYHWPAFNVADASITLGAGLLIVYIVFLDKEEKDGIS